jgi:hypothetical protein
VSEINWILINKWNSAFAFYHSDALGKYFQPVLLWEEQGDQQDLMS